MKTQVVVRWNKKQNLWTLKAPERPLTYSRTQAKAWEDAKSFAKALRTMAVLYNKCGKIRKRHNYRRTCR